VLLVGIFLLAAMMTQMFSLDVAFLFAGDMMAYFELFAIVTMIAARGQVQLLLRVSKELDETGHGAFAAAARAGTGNIDPCRASPIAIEKR